LTKPDNGVMNMARGLTNFPGNRQVAPSLSKK
jgi:hypothetical protein